MSQETERYQLENNGNTYLVRSPASGGGGIDVVANPEGTATTDLEKLKVGETIYGIPPVVGANPVLAGTEPNLTGLQVGDTKYAVPTGMANPMTAVGDLIVGGANGTPVRKAKGNARQYFGVDEYGTQNYKNLSLNDLVFENTGNQYKVPYIAGASVGPNIVSYGKPAQDFGLGFLTTAPIADNTDGIKIVVLTTEPATRYNGYLYIITA